MKDDVVIVLTNASLFLYFGDNGSSSHAIHAAAATNPALVAARAPCTIFQDDFFYASYDS
jgi:hypothetical protein